MKKAKTSIKVMLRLIKDIANGTFFRFTKSIKMPTVLGYSLELAQEIKPSPTFKNKVYNITLASQRISDHVIYPGQVFSFWYIVGNPERGFKKGRSITNGQLTEETGGGLCQVSGIIYHAALLGGLTILERHNHSVDIYNDETRFTPLGTDATVVYGYKDLRLLNNLGFPVRFSFVIIGRMFTVRLQSAVKIEKKALIYETENLRDTVVVKVLSDGGHVLNSSRYKKPQA